jgi:hypothetical protein
MKEESLSLAADSSSCQRLVPAAVRTERTTAEARMVACEQGYLCDVCGADVEAIVDSDLYLRYILGEVSPLVLPSQRERHIRCNPTLAQYIVDPGFEPVRCEGFFAKESLDPGYVAEQEARVTRAWRRLQEIPKLGLPITEYPLPEVLQEWATQAKTVE